MPNLLRHKGRLDFWAAVAAGITLALAVLTGPPLSPIETRDTSEYVAVAGSLGSEWAQDRPPAYPLVIRLTREAAGQAWPSVLVRVQVGLLVLTSIVAYRALRRRGLSRELAALTAAAACSTPSLIFHSRALVPEVLMAALLTLAWSAALRAMDGDSPGHGTVRIALLAGFWSGAAALTKPVWVLGALPLALGVLLGRRAEAATRRRAALGLIVVHALLVLSWQGFLLQRFGQRSPSRIGTVNLNLAGIRLGMTRYGAGTPLYRFLERAGLLDAALRLRFEDLDGFNRIKDALPDEIRIDREFERKVVLEHLGTFLRLQLPRGPAFFFTRPLDSDLNRPGGGWLGKLRALHRRVYAAYFRVDVGSWKWSPCLILLAAGAVACARRPGFRELYGVTLLCLGMFVLMTVVLSFQDATFSRYRAEIEPMLLCVTLLPLALAFGQRPGRDAAR